MSQTVAILQICSGLALVGLVLLQNKGTGLGRTFGSTTYHSKRGLEKIAFRATILSSVLLVIFSSLRLFV